MFTTFCGHQKSPAGSDFKQSMTLKLVLEHGRRPHAAFSLLFDSLTTLEDIVLR
jgi:hypothetical protein